MLALALSDFVDGDNIWVLQARRSLRFGPEALDLGGTGQLTGQDHLHRDRPVQTDLPGLIDHTHAPARDFFQQFIVPEATDRSPIRWERGQG
jgi:hypothetical protein